MNFLPLPPAGGFKVSSTDEDNEPDVFYSDTDIFLQRNQRYCIQFDWQLKLTANIGYSEVSYFQIKILDESEDHSTIGIGVGEVSNVRGMVGWENSIGFHSDDGKLFISNGKGGKLLIQDGFGKGDKVGLLLLYPELYFVKNGQVVDHCIRITDKNWVPTVTCGEHECEFRKCKVTTSELMDIIYSVRAIPSFECMDH